MAMTNGPPFIPLVTPSPFCNQLQGTLSIPISSSSTIIACILCQRTTDQVILIDDIFPTIKQVITNFDGSDIEYIKIIINLLFEEVKEEVYWTVIAFASLHNILKIN